MRTVRSISRLPGGGRLASGCVCPGGCLPGRGCLPPPPQQNHRRLWKPNLAATTLRTLKSDIPREAFGGDTSHCSHRTSQMCLDRSSYSRTDADAEDEHKRPGRCGYTEYLWCISWSLSTSRNSIFLSSLKNEKRGMTEWYTLGPAQALFIRDVCVYINVYVNIN